MGFLTGHVRRLSKCTHGCRRCVSCTSVVNDPLLTSNDIRGTESRHCVVDEATEILGGLQLLHARRLA